MPKEKRHFDEKALNMYKLSRIARALELFFRKTTDSTMQAQTLSREEVFLPTLGKKTDGQPITDLSKVVVRKINAAQTEKGQVLTLSDGYHRIDTDLNEIIAIWGYQEAVKYVGEVLAETSPNMVYDTHITLGTVSDSSLLIEKEATFFDAPHGAMSLKDLPKKVSLTKIDKSSGKNLDEFIYMYGRLSRVLETLLVQMLDCVVVLDNGELEAKATFEKEFDAYMLMAGVILDAAADLIFMLDILGKKQKGVVRFTEFTELDLITSEAAVTGLKIEGTSISIYNADSAKVADFGVIVDPTHFFNWLRTKQPALFKEKCKSDILWPKDNVLAQYQIIFFILGNNQYVTPKLFSEYCQLLTKMPATHPEHQTIRDLRYEEVVAMHLGKTDPLVDYRYETATSYQKESMSYLPEVMRLVAKMLMVPSF